ncbi:MAG: methylmalonyl-CoA mutase family protein, partial [Fibrobacteria bacterium]|nr:methylmalonyl-CoA mutase family protein [Fibrobacteria bacterium]
MDPRPYRPKNPVRVITATSLFDGHDAAINIMRRMLQNTGAEVIHLGHNRSVQEIVNAAIEEDAQGIAVSSYQGGHIEFFKYMVDRLKVEKASHIKIFAGGGGVIVPDEINELEAYGVTKVFSPEDGATLGLQGMINVIVKSLDFSTLSSKSYTLKELATTNKNKIANIISTLEQSPKGNEKKLNQLKTALGKKCGKQTIPVIGITGTGGAGKSSLTDEIILRLLSDFPKLKIAVVCSDPSRRKTGGALLGDRIRMNAINHPNVYMRSLATRKSHAEMPKTIKGVLLALKAAVFDIIIAETAGIGQGDSNISLVSDISLYVMTSEFGAATQLEKIDMLDYSDLIVVNKFEKGGEDAVRDVRKQVQRNHNAFAQNLSDMPVYGAIAARFNDDGVTALYHGILDILKSKLNVSYTSTLPCPETKTPRSKTIIIPQEQIRYLSDISQTVRKYHTTTNSQCEAIRKVWHLEEAIKATKTKSVGKALQKEIIETKKVLREHTKELLEFWNEIQLNYCQDELVYQVRNKEIRIPLYEESLSGHKIPKIALPKYVDPGERYRWLRRENIPGHFPFTSGVFPLKRVGEDPTRMFAGEGDPAKTNKRFKLLSKNYKAKRLSTAFDSVTLYGCDPDKRPDIYGKVGNSGVSICTLEDMKTLYDGFDLCSPTTSVSMTINGPAPIMLAMYLNTAIDQQTTILKEKGKTITPKLLKQCEVDVLKNVRGTVQADILKEDQGQNTCIYSIEFALKMMGDMQEYFIKNEIKNFYSVSISGYHIAEAGANPITQLAFTLANGFTYVEYYLSRGMPLDQFAPNLSFFFSNGMDPEYTVIGRVARRIWAITMKERYGASLRSQMLKYHIQTSGRSLHNKDIQFNDIRTSLQALCAVYDNCNSLHTNAFDEAITTPSPDSVRRALAIQMIINREWGLAKNENMLQGSFIVEELTDLVEEAVLQEFDRITERGGVLGAMETGYQRSKIQEESSRYEALKHSGEHPIVGVNTFLNPDDHAPASQVELSRATDKEKNSQLKRLHQFQK